MRETGRYRQNNEPTNHNCPICQKDIWVPKRIMTVYEGKESYASDATKETPECVYNFHYGAVCKACYDQIPESLRIL